MLRSILAALILSAPALALAAEDETSEPAPEPTAEAPAEAGDTADGPRRRRATTLGVGLETVSDGFGNKLTATMGGLETAFGMQINDLVGVYVPLHLSMGSFRLGDVGGIPVGLTGTLAATVVADVTLIDRVFVGGGLGYGILNNPSGPVVHLRAGGYPLMGRVEGTNRRRGLVTAVDLRMFFASANGQKINALFPMLNVGYASF